MPMRESFNIPSTNFAKDRTSKLFQECADVEHMIWFMHSRFCSFCATSSDDYVFAMIVPAHQYLSRNLDSILR